MRSLLCLQLLLLAAVTADRKADIISINLDLPAEKRWVEFTHKYAAQANVTLQYLEKMTGKGSPLHPIVENLRKAVLEGGSWTAEHLAEMKGIAEAGGFKEEQIQDANLFYEFGTLGPFPSPPNDERVGLMSPIGCTSIVAQTLNGEILHARNQDYSLPNLINITVQVEFIKGGEVIYQGTTFAGYIGLPTAMRNPSKAGVGGWSISADSRFDGGGINLFENIKVAKQGYKTVGIMIRDMCENAETYEKAIHIMNYTGVIAPAYYIMAGAKAGEGAVITRNREGPDNSHDNEGIWSLDLKAGNWYRLETNWDHWLSDAHTDGRRKAATTSMNKIGQNDVTLENMFSLLSTRPVLAKDTVYTDLMQPKTGRYETTLRDQNF